MTNQLQKIKADLIAELDKRIADQIIEQTNADLLKKLITNAETINEAIMIAELGTTYKRTGFHFDKRLEKMTDTIKYFKKNEKLSFVQDPNALTHKLIIGDNYDALLNLLIQYRGKIDVIYIDPPYGKDAMGEFAKTNYNNAITRDNLLSMLYPRLVLARQLLCDNGVIFCSIDDKNQAYVKGLFDEVFGEGNFAVVFPWQKRTAKSDVPYGISQDYEWVICYAKNNFIAGLSLERRYYQTPDFPNDKWRLADLTTQKVETDRPNSAFNLVDPKTGKIYPYNPSRLWGITKDTFDDYYKRGKIVFPDDYDFLKINIPAYRVFESEDKLKALKKYGSEYAIKSVSTNLPKEVGMTKDGNREIIDIFGKIIFPFPKPSSLIKYFISITNNKSCVILDFFAGSGTTGQAVLELNKQDGGKRQFILVNANEITDTTPNGIVYDVTSKRLKRVMTGECYDGTRNFKWNEKNEPLGDNLDVYDIATVANFEATEGNTPFEVIDETLYGKEKLGVQEKIQWVCEHFEHTQKKLSEE
jgi:adenine-specific DNA-methyltransferase